MKYWNGRDQISRGLVWEICRARPRPRGPSFVIYQQSFIKPDGEAICVLWVVSCRTFVNSICVLWVVSSAVLPSRSRMFRWNDAYTQN
jgi:hypothetical protein